MGWNGFTDNNGRANKGYIEEGNLKCFQFSEQPTRVRFLTEDFSIEDIMAEQQIGREEAQDYLMKLAQDKWIMPKSYWEHSIKSIPNVRFFSTAVCLGRGRCSMCVENDEARDNGVTENKLLPYPVRKRFVAPVWCYDLNMVLYVRGNEEFFDGVAAYINKHGSKSDFDIYKKGKGFDTTYHAVFDGEAKEVLPELNVIAPRDIDMFCGDVELNRRLVGGKPDNKPAESKPEPKSAEKPAEKAPAPEAKPESKPESKPEVKPEAKTNEVFTIPFGQHKGKTYEQLQNEGNGEYIKFLAENSAGVVQQTAKEYLGLA